jgi:aspartyl/glutamyl-tRNA(Asn/Gln) amidotransferase C subunit
MISREDIDNLANLARLALDDAQKESLIKDLDNILGYFEQLKEARVGEVKTENYLAINVMRADEANTGVEFRQNGNGQYIRVKKIL